MAILDGDDYWTDSNKLQKQVDFLESHPEYAICFHNARILREDGTKENKAFSPPDQKETSSLEDLLAGNFIFTGSVMYRRGLFGELPEWFHTVNSGDWALHALNAQNGLIGYLNEMMATYRVHATGLWSLEKSASQLTDAIALLDNLNAYLGFKFDRQIKASKGKYYEELTDIHEQKGDLVGATRFLAKRLGLDLSNSRIPHKYFLWKLIKLQIRTCGSWLGLLRRPVDTRP